MRRIQAACRVTFVGILVAVWVVWCPRAGAVQPITSKTYYVTRYSLQDAQTLGCSRAQADTAAGKVNSVVVLDFGAQSSGNTGTYLPLTNTYISYASVQAYAERFGLFYKECLGSNTNSVLRLGVGTNNSGSGVNSAKGASWGSIVNSVADWIAAYAGQVNVVGANDIEPAWDSYSTTAAWVSGYSKTTSRSYDDYGSADGCLQTVGGVCSNGWTQANVRYVSWGATLAFPLPEIYYQYMGAQWKAISASGAPISFIAPLSEYHRDARTDTPAQSWQHLGCGITVSCQYLTEIYASH
jgi:hypothetical protein